MPGPEASDRVKAVVKQGAAQSDEVDLTCGRAVLLRRKLESRGIAESRTPAKEHLRNNSF